VRSCARYRHVNFPGYTGSRRATVRRDRPDDDLRRRECRRERQGNLAQATASKVKAEQAVADAATAAAMARAVLMSAREHLTELDRRVDAATAVRAQRGAAEKVSQAEGLQDAAAAVLVTAEQEEKDAGGASAAAETAARAIAASLGIDKRLVRPGVGTISSPYGMRRHPVTGVHKLHSGTDFQYAGGKAYAAATGTVAAVTNDSAYGNMVTIAHGKGIVTRYAHLATPLVRPGDEIAAAQVIGQIGSTGLSTGPHLHFEVQVGGEFQDPAVWLAR